MKKLLILFFIAINVSAYSQQDYWQQSLDYTIDVSLNDQEHSLDGFMKLRYKNNSRDTLHFIWFQLWPNAYKNDRTAFSEQLLQNGRTDFYFAERDERGYINRLDFRSGNNGLKTEDHPLYIDLVKVMLDAPLAPGKDVEITTPFHVKLPANFSRSGHTGQSYQATQWYPKPAVYDKTGWHPMPYLELGEFYGEFGTYNVQITVPENYVVAATGDLQNENEKNWLRQKGTPPPPPVKVKTFGAPKKKTPVTKYDGEIKSSAQTKTLRYIQNNVHDFAWFADKYFGVLYDTIKLTSGRTVDAYSFYSHGQSEMWSKSMQMIKDAVHFRSALIGEYPYNTISAVQAKIGVEGGMEYPTITSISAMPDLKTLDIVLQHEIGHNWFYGILASNERDHPWLDEGVNSYYDERYKQWKYHGKDWQESTGPFIAKRLPDDENLLAINMLATLKKDQPVITSSQDFTGINYALVAYSKTANLLKKLEDSIGREKFDAIMQNYYSQWKFRHPQPADFFAAFEKNNAKELATFKEDISTTGNLFPETIKRKKVKPAFLFNLRDTDKYSYINFLPAIGRNKYDGLMLGLLVHNYNLPPDRFRFVAVPLFGFTSKQINGTGGVNYNWFPDNNFYRIQASVGFSKFSTMSGTDSVGSKIYGGFVKFAPALKFVFKPRSLQSSRESWIELKSFLLRERGFNYVQKLSDSNYYPERADSKSRYVNQLTFSVTEYRALYPYDLQLQLQQGEGFFRASATANYFLNYGDGGGASARFFAAKFGYLGEKTIEKEFETQVYQPKLTAVRGYEDYTYSNPFVGRNENDGYQSQQVMIRDGGLKLRTDLFQGLQGRSDNWIGAINLTTSIPTAILPKQIPLKLFLDVGTYAESWEKQWEGNRFLFVGGLQLSLIQGLVNIYAPLVYSKEFRDNLKTVPEENKFFRKISFSIDIHRFDLRKFTKNKFPF
ncbi:MAG: M1 family metallopeptidase [Chitinophagaceae bacterium]|nr:M1 family metallopeptidase [Chitinophagaceae bacterium]